MRIDLSPHLLEAVKRTEGNKGAKALVAAGVRAASHLEHLITTLTGPEPATQSLLFVAGPPTSVGDVPVDPRHLLGGTTPTMTSVLLAAALKTLSTDHAFNAVRARRAARSSPARLSQADEDASTLGVELDHLSVIELAIFYRPHPARHADPAAEAVDVDDALTAALTDIRGGAILEKSGVLWNVRVP